MCTSTVVGLAVTWFPRGAARCEGLMYLNLGLVCLYLALMYLNLGPNLGFMYPT